MSDPGLAGFLSVGFSGSRSSSPGRAGFLASEAAAAGARVLVGCAAGVDRVVRAAAPGALVFQAVAAPRAPWPSALVARSVALVRALAAGPRPCLVVFPAIPCPARLSPSPAWSSAGSGSWSSAALAAGLGVPVFVFLPGGVPPPGSWGPWSLVACGPLVGSWSWSPPRRLL